MGPRWLVIGLVLCALALGGCASSPTIAANQGPLYNEASHTSRIKATAQSNSGLDYIQILATTGRALSCDRGDANLPSPIPCRGEASTSSHACFFYNNETTGDCTFEIPIPAVGTLVTFTARAKDKSGRFAIQDPVTYSGGQRIEENYCWHPSFTGLFGDIDCSDFAPLMPIWWQTQTPAGGSSLRKDQIDISLNEDVDAPLTDAAYSTALNMILLNVFFNKSSSWSDDFSYALNNFALWSGPAGADRDACGSGDFSFGGWSKYPTGYTDAEVIFHTDAAEPRGCARLSFGGPSWEYILRNGAAQRFVHEKGHSLAALGDEYAETGRTNYKSSSVPNNVHQSKTACESVAVELALATTLCQEIGNSGKWRITDGSVEIMDNDQDTNSDWRDASQRAIRRLLRRCDAGNCF